MDQQHTPHDSQYFVMGNTKIVIKEHFKDDGKSLKDILMSVILNAGK